MNDIILHGGDYNPEQWIVNNNFKELIDNDIEELKKRKINTLTIGVFSWVYYNPGENIYNFDYLDYIFEAGKRENMKIIMATPSGGFPNWIKIKYPSINRVTKDNVRELYGNRHNFCYSSEDTLREIRKINQVLANRYKDEDIFIWHISNEMDGECYCENCKTKFRVYLENKFNSIDNLNYIWNMTFWSHTYNSFDEIEPPFSFGDGSNPSLYLEWKRFGTQNAIDMYNFEVESVKEIIPSAKFTTNFCYGNGHRFNYQKLAQHLDVVSWDSYHEWNKGDDHQISKKAQFNFDLMRGLKQENFLMIESTPNTANWRYASKNKRPKVNESVSMLSIACGSQMVGYFQMKRSRNHAELFHSGVLDPFISGDRIGEELKELGKKLEISTEILNTEVKSDIALIYDYEVRDIIEINVGPRKIGGMHYNEYVEKIHDSLTSLKTNIDIVNLNSDLSKYKLIIVPMHFMIDESQIEKLQTLKDATIVITGFTGLADSSNNLNFGGRNKKLDELLGNEIIEYEALYDEDCSLVNYNNREYKTTVYHEYVRTTTAETLATYNFDLYDKSPLITKNNNIIYIGGLIESEFYKDFAKNHLNYSEKIDKYVYRTRENDKYIYEFYFNYDKKIELESIGIDLFTGEKISQFTLDKYEYKVIRKEK